MDDAMRRDASAAPPAGAAEADEPRGGGSLVAWLRRAAESETAADDLAHGQSVIVSARWVLVGAGLALALWSPGAIGPLRLQVLVLLLIAVANFFLHAQLLRRHGAVDRVAYVASASDLAVISLLAASQGGFDSNLFAFYFPAVLALSVAFPPKLTAIYAGAAMWVYAVICLHSLSGSEMTSANLQILLTRVLMVAAVAVCGAVYQHVEQSRRAGETMPDALAASSEA